MDTTLTSTLQSARRRLAPQQALSMPGAMDRATGRSSPLEGSGTVDPDRLLEALYDAHADAIYRWILGMLGRREEAEDALQAVWLNLARRIDAVAAAQDRTAYVWATARHRVNSVLRRRALERLWTPPLDDTDLALPEAVHADAARPGIDDDERRDLGRAVARLRPRLRAVVLLVGFAGCTLEETAARLGIPRGTAASRYHAAVQRLRCSLKR